VTRRLDTCVHEAGHALVAVHFHGPCIKSVTLHPDGGGRVEVSVAALKATPLEEAAYALAGGVAERLLTPWAPDPNPSAEDLEILAGAYRAWSGGSTNELERRAFTAAAARTARAVLYARRAELAELAKSLAEGRGVPDEYLAPTTRAVKAQEVPWAPTGGAAPPPGVKTTRDMLATDYLARLEANIRRVDLLSGRIAPRDAWGQP